MKIKEVIQFLEGIAPRSSQESYDNSGLLVGDSSVELTEALICLDSTEIIVEEAIEKGCNLIIAHHPIIFKGLKKLTGANYIERVIAKCIKHDIALYAIHTNLDNYKYGVSHEMANRLGLINQRVLEPKRGVLHKITTYVPKNNLQTVLDAMFAAGAGSIGNYSHCSFQVEGVGTFLPGDAANPTIGAIGTLEQAEEVRVECIVSSHLSLKVIAALKQAHVYEEVAYQLVELLNENQDEGAGIVGDLPEEKPVMEVLQQIKDVFECGVVRYTQPVKEKVKRIALCGGSGSFLLGKAMGEGADIYLTADFKYHEFFDAENRIVIADIGHYESEQFTIQLLGAILKKNFPKFAFRLTSKNTNPINYL